MISNLLNLTPPISEGYGGMSDKEKIVLSIIIFLSIIVFALIAFGIIELCRHLYKKRTNKNSSELKIFNKISEILKHYGTVEKATVSKIAESTDNVAYEIAIFGEISEIDQARIKVDFADELPNAEAFKLNFLQNADEESSIDEICLSGIDIYNKQ